VDPQLPAEETDTKRFFGEKESVLRGLFSAIIDIG
jgi:hypothetical protein